MWCLKVRERKKRKKKHHFIKLIWVIASLQGADTFFGCCLTCTFSVGETRAEESISSPQTRLLQDSLSHLFLETSCLVKKFLSQVTKKGKNLSLPSTIHDNSKTTCLEKTSQLSRWLSCRTPCKLVLALSPERIHWVPAEVIFLLGAFSNREHSLFTLGISRTDLWIKSGDRKRS